MDLREKYNGKKTVAKPLVLLVDFKDYKFNDIKKEETPRNFKDWSKKHYEDMIFGNKTYKGPKGEELYTLKQYYEEQSGGSFTLEGGVAGWYTARNNAEHYGKPYRENHDSNVEQLVKEAFEQACKDNSIDLSEYDVEDPFDRDEDGNLHEPDGIIDNLILVHAGKGEEVGGGTLGENAIWSHRDRVSGMIGYSKKDVHGNNIGIRDYMIVSQDTAIGILAHEYGHILGLPDEYNIVDSNFNTPIGYWSIMASGSWGGVSAGTDPTGFSPWCKQYLQDTIGGNWLNKKEINLEDIDNKGLDILLDEASKKGKNEEVIRINLPKQNSNNRGEKDRYYLLEWRNNEGTDKALPFGEGGKLGYNSGLVIWYVDENYLEKDKNGVLTGKKDNDVKSHPGYGFIGVVDADQHILHWQDPVSGELKHKASSDYHIHDAAFGIKKNQVIYVDNIKNQPGLILTDDKTFMHPIFDDSKDYSNEGIESAGRILSNYGLKIYVTGESKDRSVGKIHILRSKESEEKIKNGPLKEEITSKYLKSISLDKNIIKQGEKAEISVEVNKTNLKDEIVLGYEGYNKGRKIEKHINLKLDNGKYIGEISAKDEFTIGKWQPKYIILENKDGESQIIYNVSNVDIYGNSANKEDLSRGNINIISSDSNSLKIANVTGKNTLILGETSELKFNVLNEGAITKDVSLIVEVYDRNNKLIKSERKNTNIKFTENKEVGIFLDLKEGIDEGKEYIVKTILKDTKTNKNLIEPIQFKTISINSLEKQELQKYKETKNPLEIQGLLSNESSNLELSLNEYKVLNEDLKLLVCKELFNNKKTIISKEELQNLLNKSMDKVKLDQYKNAEDISALRNVLNNEPNILGINVLEYKRLDIYSRDKVVTELFNNKNELTCKEGIQDALDKWIKKETKFIDAEKKMKSFNDYMYNTWVLNRDNIKIAQSLLKEVEEALENLDTEVKERCSKNSEYVKNKKSIEDTLNKIKQNDLEISKYVNAENYNKVKELLDNKTNILGLGLKEYNNLDDDNKIIIAKNIYMANKKLKSQEDIQKIINDSLKNIKASAMDTQVLKYYNAKNKEEIKALLDLNVNSLGLKLDVYKTLDDVNKQYVTNELYKVKNKLVKKEVIQNEVNKACTEVLLMDLEDRYNEDCLGKIDDTFIKSVDNLLKDIDRALGAISVDNDKKYLINKYRCYEEIKKACKPKASVGAFKTLVSKLKKMYMNGIDNEEDIKKAEEMIKDAENMSEELKSNGKLNEIKSLLNELEIIKEDL
ncbi:immune inhibitor A domain-containing protein [Hathewaya limosa]|uniref:immune inhibitor A domain-containing protein n=1 Tax=Hathewaya limosa TaxID=1536 RepID=UPI0027D7F26E|nr:immune inhibitor A domain-containing protein [Hathewaya limosa]